MQGDGNLVAYSNGSPYWSSNTVKSNGVKTSNVGFPPYSLIMQNDGNLVLVDVYGGGDSNGNPIWQTKTTEK